MKLRSVVMPIIVANVAVFILQWVLPPTFTETFLLHKYDAFSAPWTMLTSMFMHGSITHILFNMYVLFIFGPIVEQRIGPKRFLAIYLGSGLLAAFASQFIYQAALGASGAIMGMMGVVMVLLPDLKVLFFFVLPMPMWIAGIVIAAIDLMGAFAPNSTIANVAHLVGMGTGVVYGFTLRKKKKKFDRRFSSRNMMDDNDIEDYIRNGRI